MGKVPMYTDSEETEDTCSSAENFKKKKKFSILKYTGGSVKKKKCKAHSVSEPDDSEYRTRSNQRVPKTNLRGILKHSRERESSDEDEDLDEPPPLKARDRCLVGRVPHPAGSRPGRGGGVAIVIKKNTAPLQSLPSQASNSSDKRQMKRFSRKRSY